MPGIPLLAQPHWYWWHGKQTPPSPPVPIPDFGGVVLVQGLLPLTLTLFDDAELNTKVTWLGRGASDLASAAYLSDRKWSPPGVTTDAKRLQLNSSQLNPSTGFRMNVDDNPELKAFWNPGIVTRSGTGEDPEWHGFGLGSNPVCTFFRNSEANVFYMCWADLVDSDTATVLDGFWEDATEAFRPYWGADPEPTTKAASLRSATAPTASSRSGTNRGTYTSSTTIQVYRDHTGSEYGNAFLIGVSGITRIAENDSNYYWLGPPAQFTPPEGTSGLFIAAT